VSNRLRPIIAVTLTVAAALLVFVALVVPDQLGRIKPGDWVPGAFLRLPIEGIVGAAVLLVTPARLRKPAALSIGAVIGLLTVLKLINIGFINTLNRRFDPVLDWPLFGDGFNYVEETSGKAMAVLAAVGAAVGSFALIAAVALAVLRLSGIAARHHRVATRAVPAVIAAWVAFAVIGTTLFPFAPVASDNTARLAMNTVLNVPKSLADQKAFAAAADNDKWRDVPAGQLLRGLLGKDVVIGVVESYGRSALDNPKMAATVAPALDSADAKLKAAGFGVRSGYLTSSTYGGGSWFAHSTLQTGLWIDNQQRYRQAVSSKRTTITKSFQKAGWHTVALEPGNKHTWPEKDFYGYEEVYDSRNLGYHGPQFGWSTMPDQYLLSQFQKQVYSRPGRGPIYAEVTLTSSHTPWAPLPHMVDWDAVGDGSIYGPIAASAMQKDETWRSTGQVRSAYAESIAYSVTSTIDWATKYGDDNLVMVIFGDHQASPRVSGQDASHDIPISVVAKDPAVLEQINSWNWTKSMHPDDDAPVWKMNTFRDRFLSAFAAPVASRSH
jgi:hypothetical protein